MSRAPSDLPADLEAFIARWSSGDGGQERANYALFLSELCDMIGAISLEAGGDPEADLLAKILVLVA